MITVKTKRLFLGQQAIAPWPEKLPPGRHIDPSSRHLTLLFLGEVEEDKLVLFDTLPPPPFSLGQAGWFEKPIFLPPQKPHVVAWEVALPGERPTHSYQKTLTSWAKAVGLVMDHHKNRFLPHVTIARGTFFPREWKAQFTQLPVFFGDLHLYESLGHSCYRSIRKWPIPPPFEEIEHTADFAFDVRGRDYKELFFHAAIALAFIHPPLIRVLSQKERPENIEEVVAALNAMIATVDMEVGCPLKAVSYHGHAEKRDAFFTWEMIVDV